MENPPTIKYISKTIMSLVAKNHPESDRLSKSRCAFCTQSVWSSVEGGRGDTTVECFCLKTHTMKWNGTIKSLPTDCDGFTDEPLAAEE